MNIVGTLIFASLYISRLPKSRKFQVSRKNFATNWFCSSSLTPNGSLRSGYHTFSPIPVWQFHKHHQIDTGLNIYVLKCFVFHNAKSMGKYKIIIYRKSNSREKQVLDRMWSMRFVCFNTDARASIMFGEFFRSYHWFSPLP